MPTIADFPVGTKIKFGAYSVNGEAPHKVRWIKVHHDGTILSEYMEDQCAFDAKEPDNPDEYRRSYGNNRCSVSNLQQFLNADGENWKPGFLHYFEGWEVEAIEDSEVITALPKKDIRPGGEKSETIYAKLFMPSRTNLGGGKENGVDEGEVWDLFSTGEYSRECKFTRELYENTQNDDRPEDPDDTWYYYLRSPNSGNSCSVCCVYRDGGIGNAYACDDYLGVRPALKLNPEILISDEPDDEGYYEVLNAPQEIIEIDEDVFFAILKTK